MRTPKQIAEYIDYYKDKPKAEREWAFRNLAEIEGKPIEELKELAERYRDNVGGRSKWITDDIKEQIKQAVRAGVSNLDIIADFGVSHNTVTRIKNAMRDAGEVLPETRGRRPREEQPAEKQPEAYPGQINDDEPIVEDDVKAYIPHETEIAGDCKPEPKPKKSLGESLSDLGAAFCNIFGMENYAQQIQQFVNGFRGCEAPYIFAGMNAFLEAALSAPPFNEPEIKKKYDYCRKNLKERALAVMFANVPKKKPEGDE